MKSNITSALCACLLWVSGASAQAGRRGGGERMNLQNRSVNTGRTFDNNANVNRNVNVNQNVNVNRNVNVNTSYRGGCYHCGGYYYHDSDWNWGSFAAGAATAAVTKAAVTAATRPSTTVVATAPAVGTVVTTLPGQCATEGAGGAVVYNCNKVYYRPYYQGSTLVYRVVTYP